jgi:hypothetical protein
MGDFLDVKRCTKKISTARFNGKRIIIGSVTDAYNLFEKSTVLPGKYYNNS